MRKRSLSMIAGAVAVLLVGGLAPQATALPDWRYKDCRFQGVQPEPWTYEETVLTIRCAANKIEPLGGTEQALDTWRCESGWGKEPPHSDSFHGPYQFLKSTFASTFRHARDSIVRWFDLKQRIHNVRTNVFMFLAKARYSLEAWSNCA